MEDYKIKSKYLDMYLDKRKKNKINPELDSLIYEIEKTYTPGCYFLYDSDMKLNYVGVSNNLASRSVQSYYQRKKIIKYISFYFTNSTSDAVVFESYFICKYKPKLNIVGKYKDYLTLDLGINLPKKIYQIFLDKNKKL